MKISLSDILSGVGLSKINNNFDQIQDELNNKVLYRASPPGEPNQMEGNLDMNGKKIYNLPAPSSDNEVARLKDVRNAIYGAAGHTANLIDFNPIGDISSTTVQGAVEEVNSFIGNGTGATTRFLTAKLKDYVHIKDFGAVCDGVTDDTQALIKGDAYTAANGLTLRISGTPLIKQPITFTGKSSWEFEGSTGVLATDRPIGRFIKHSSVAGDLFTFTANGVSLINVAIDGQVGNTGCGVTLVGNSPRCEGLFVSKMGSHGLRIGSDTPGFNMNSFIIRNPRCIANLGCGIYLSDVTINANAGLIDSPTCNGNVSHGFYGNKAALGVTILCPTFESNGGYGAYFDAFFGYIGANLMIGGDIEANTLGNLYEVSPYQTIIIGTSVQGKTRIDRAQLSAFTPTIIGSTTPGVGTYSKQQGCIEVSGSTVFYTVSISWTAHTGTGNIMMQLPRYPYQGATVCPDLMWGVNVISSGITLPAGAHPGGLLVRDTGQVSFNYSNAGALASLPMSTSGTLYVRGSFPLNAPNYFTI